MEALSHHLRAVQIDKVYSSPYKRAVQTVESNESAQRRGVETIEWLRNNNLGQSIAIGSHGDLMALILNYYQPSFDYDFWRHLEMPDTYKLTFEGSRFKSIEHVSKNTLNK